MPVSDHDHHVKHCFSGPAQNRKSLLSVLKCRDTLSSSLHHFPECHHVFIFSVCVHRDCKAPFVFVLNVIFSKAPCLGLVMAWATSLDPYNPDKPWSQLTPHERCLQE